MAIFEGFEDETAGAVFGSAGLPAARMMRTKQL
jgi:hypothetical protein